MATIISNGTGGGLWNAGATWVGGVAPVDDDTVVIASGDVVEFNDDTSGFANGINGITITGTLKLTRTAGTYYLKMKAATTIAGAGTFDCGTLASPIPFAAKHTITGDTSWSISGSDGLTMSVYAAEPSILYVKLTQDEAIGATVLHVDTDVSSDIWADGDTIHVNDINQAKESEERIIATGGIAAGTITITVGLTAAKSTGAYIPLMTRNVRFIKNASSGIANNFGSKLTIAGGQWSNVYIFSVGNGGPAVSGGTFAGSSSVFHSSLSYTISGGVFSGCGTAVAGEGIRVSGGLYTGCNYCFQFIRSVISGVLCAGNNRIFSNCNSVVILGGTYLGNTSGVHASSGIKLYNAVFQTNTQDIFQSVFVAFNTAMLSASEVTGVGTYSVKEMYSESIDHDQVAGAFKSWTIGGTTTKQAVVFPTGYTNSMNTVLASATIEGYWQKEVTIGAGASVNISMYLRKNAAMTYLPRIIVFNKASTDPFAGGAGLYTFTMTDSIDTWEDDLYTYTNSGTEDVTLVIRCQGMNATGNMYSVADVEQINVDLTTALANIATIDTVVDAIKAKTDQLAFTVANQVDANALTGGGGATAEDVRIEIDANSTQLSAIKAKTDNLPASPAAVGSAMTLADDSITAAKFDESTAFPVKSADTGATQIARVGADSDTLETLSDQMDAVAVAIEAVDDLVDTEVAAILADTNELQTDLTNGGRLDLLIDAIKAKTDNLPASPAAVGSAMTLADDAITAAKFDESTAFPVKSADTGATQIARVGADSDTLETLSDQIDAIGVYGLGSETWEYTVTDGSGNPVPDVLVEVSSDIAGTVILDRGITNASGVVTFHLDPGTVYVWRYKYGYTGTNPDTETVP
jgi:hypothetical protein